MPVSGTRARAPTRAPSEHAPSGSDDRVATQVPEGIQGVDEIRRRSASTRSAKNGSPMDQSCSRSSCSTVAAYSPPYARARLAFALATSWGGQAATFDANLRAAASSSAPDTQRWASPTRAASSPVSTSPPRSTAAAVP